MPEDAGVQSLVATQDLYHKLIALIREQSGLFLELGLVFKEIHDRQLYKDMQEGGFDTWKQFLSQPEIGVKPSTAYFYIQIYETFLERIGLEHDYVAGIPFYKLQKLLPVVRKKDPAEARVIVEDLVVLGANDFNDEIDKLKGHTNKKEQPPSVKRCETCDKWKLLLKEEDICHCQST